MTRLQPRRSITEKKALVDIMPPKPPPGVPSARWNKAYPASWGDVAVGWHRGHQAGIHSAYLTLKKHYPNAARQLIEAFSMDEKGVVSI